MAGYNKFYEGADYGLERPNYGEFLGMSYRHPASGISVATDPRTANQIKMVTEKLSTGAKAVEVQLTMPEVAESVPNQHLEELNKLRKLTGVDFTLHGPLVEPTGVTRQGWDETHRQQAERQMWSALQRGNLLDPKGNIVVTFHSSNGLPEPETKVMNEKTKEEEIKSIFVVDERNGQFSPVTPKEHHFPGQEKDPYKEIENQNEETWFKALQQVNFHAHQGEGIIKQALGPKENAPEEFKALLKKKPLQEFYKEYSKGDGAKIIKELGPMGNLLEAQMTQITHGDIYLRDAYGELKGLYDRAYDATLRSSKSSNEKIKKKAEEDLRKLKSFADEIDVKGIEKDVSKVDVLADEIVKGVNVLRSISTPQTLRPLREFAIEQASETFSNLALRSYDKFKDSSPVISIENPPAGSGLNRAQDLKDLIVASRNKFIEKAEKAGLSKYEAEKQAEKLIGATWDIGHINMIRKFGYGEKALTEETKKIAKYVKNVHLSDNFGMEHTELPMGMGNVPTKAHMEILDAYNKQLKKVIEAGNWYQHFQTTPLPETLAAFGSPLYSMQLGPSWNQVYGRISGNYFAGYGLNPDVHHSIYGAGFAGLPVELGGQIPGRQSRLSGTPME